MPKATKDILQTGSVQMQMRTGRILALLHVGHITTAFSQVTIPKTTDVLIEGGAYRLLENGGKLILG